MKRSTAARLTIFNHKGGVGKTTLSVNIAAAMAKLGKRVLLIDSDPQCNITSYLVEETVVDDLLVHSDDPEGETIWSGIRPILKNKGDFRYIEPYEVRDNVLLLPGDIRLAEYENRLSDAWGRCFQSDDQAFQLTTAMSALVNAIATEEKVDYVFYDTGPNIGALNRVLLLDCDFFIVPGACDWFSTRGLTTLGQILKTWIQLWKTLVDQAPDDALLLPGMPVFLGYIPQRFKVYGNRIVKDHSEYLSRFQRRLATEVIAVLHDLHPGLAPTASSDSKLGQVQDFGVLAQKAQEQGVPIAALSGIPEAKQIEAERCFRNIAKNIIEKTSQYSKLRRRRRREKEEA